MESRPTPIYSTFEDDPAHCEDIDQFVVTLGERVDELQDAEATRDFGLLLERAQALADAARDNGYESLREVALEVCRACADDKADAAQEALVELTDLGRRVRLGHRGAAG